MTFEQALKKRMPDCALQKNVPLAPYTTMRIGGNADYFLEIEGPETLLAALSAARETDTPRLILGNGSNLLISDEGVEGVALHFGQAFSAVTLDDGLLVAQAGALLAAISRFALNAGLAGLEFAAGIPGSIGGAATMNAGAYGGEMAHVLSFVELFEGDRVVRRDVSEMDYGYRHSRVMDADAVVLRAGFRLAPDGREAILSRMNDLSVRRREKQPLQLASAGSFFKRPEGHYAGALIEQAGLKGFRVGDAQVSEKHAGFLVNLGHASCRDMLALMRHVQDAVFALSGVRLEPEVRLLGRGL